MDAIVSFFQRLGLKKGAVLVASLLLLISGLLSDPEATPSSSEEPAYSTVLATNSGAGFIQSSLAEFEEVVSENSYVIQYALDAAVLKSKTVYLEYGTEALDPMRFVECDNPDVVLSTSDSIDLQTVGDAPVMFRMALDSFVRSQVVTFRVRDTHGPNIEINEKSIIVAYGDTPDLQANVLTVSDDVDGRLTYVSNEPETAGTDAGNERFYESGWYRIDGPSDLSQPGTYTYTVVAADIHGNRATKEFSVTVEEPPVAETAPAPVNTRAYVVNTNTGKFHNSWCRYVNTIASHNRWDVETTREELIDRGYEPCKVCNP